MLRKPLGDTVTRDSKFDSFLPHGEVSVAVNLLLLLGLGGDGFSRVWHALSS
jgi:hypothetical protein